MIALSPEFKYTAPGDVWEVILQFDIALCDHKPPYFLEGGRSGVTYIQLSQVGTSYFVTSNQASCRNGMAMAINVAAASNSTSISSLNATLPGAKSYLVGDTNQGTMATPWGLPATTDHYKQWATNITFKIGDVLGNFVPQNHVVLLNRIMQFTDSFLPTQLHRDSSFLFICTNFGYLYLILWPYDCWHFQLGLYMSGRWIGSRSVSNPVSNY